MSCPPAALALQVSQQLLPRCHDSFLLKSIEGSDHIPLGLVIKLAA